MTLQKFFKGSLVIQVFMFGSGILLQFMDSHDGIDDQFGLIAVVPIATSIHIGLVNIVLTLIYLFKIATKKLTMDTIILLLFVINLICVIFFNSFVSWAESGPG